jgi:hypothetical protein
MGLVDVCDQLELMCELQNPRNESEMVSNDFLCVVGGLFHPFSSSFSLSVVVSCRFLSFD